MGWGARSIIHTACQIGAPSVEVERVFRAGGLGLRCCAGFAQDWIGCFKYLVGCSEHPARGARGLAVDEIAHHLEGDLGDLVGTHRHS